MPFLLLLLFFTATAQAQIFQGPVSAALAGSGRAGLDANEGTFLNPALIAILSKSEVAGYYKDGSADRDTHRQALGASISENGEEVLVPGEVAYLRTRNTGLTPQAADGELFYGAFGKLLFDRLAVGVSFYHLTEKPEGQPTTEQWNGALGSVFMIIPDLGVAYVFDNPVHPTGNVPQPLVQLPQQSFGVFYRTPYQARLRLDVIRLEQNNPNHSWDVHPSIETELNQYWLFRMGARFDETEDQRFITLGIAFNGPGLKIDYAIEKNLEHTGGAVHSVDIRSTF